MRRNILTVAISAALSTATFLPLSVSAAEQGSFGTDSSQGSSNFTINANPSIRISNFRDFIGTPQGLQRSGEFSLLRVRDICVFSNINDRRYTITAVSDNVAADPALTILRDPSQNALDAPFVTASVAVLSQNSGGKFVPLPLGVETDPFTDPTFGGTFSLASANADCVGGNNDGRIELRLSARTDEIGLLPEGAYSTTVTLVVAPNLN